MTDHNPNTHLQTQPNLSRRQARWAEYLQRFQFKWEYRAGRTNIADPLSRHPDFAVKLTAMVTRGRTRGPVQSVPQARSDVAPVTGKRRRSTPTPAPAFTSPDVVASDSDADDEMYATIRAGYDTDPWFSHAVNTKALTWRDNLWWNDQRVVIPDVQNMRRRILYELHDAPYSGHCGMTKTLRAVTQVFWWPGVKQEVQNYVRACISCQRNKSTNLLPGGLLQPLPIPENPWDSVSMDFIVQLPQTDKGFDAILVFVDRLTKMTHLAPTVTTVDSAGTT